MAKGRKPRKPRAPLPIQQDMPPAANPQLGAAIREIVATQLETGEPPETQATLERLVREGHTRAGAEELIAYVVVSEIFGVMARGEEYNAARYIDALNKLPELPDDETYYT